MLTKKEADKLIRLNGESRGANIKVDLDFILETKGEKGLRKLEKRMAELGYPLDYKNIKEMDFYPIGFDAIILLSIKDVFNFKYEDIEKMGSAVVKFSPLIKVFMKYFGSLKLVSGQIPDMWKKHYTIGKLIMTDFSEEKRYIIIREEDFKIHPVYCSIHKGYFIKVVQLIVKSLVTCQETKCMFKDDPYHEFLLTW